MRLELSTAYAAHSAAEEAILRCYKLGFTNIQLSCLHRRANLNKILEIKNSLKLNLSMHAPFPAPRDFTVDPSCSNERLRAKSEKILLESMRNADKLGIERVVVHSSEPSEKRGKKSCLDSLIKTLSALVRQAEKNGQIVCIENKMRTTPTGYDIEGLLTVMNKIISPNLKLCFDTGHAIAAYGNEKKVISIFKELLPFIAAVHLFPASEREHWDIYTTPDIDPHFYRKIIETLINGKYDGNITFEVVPEVPESEIIKGQEYIRGTIAEILAEKFID